LHEIETATELPALEDGSLRMRNCVLVQRKEERDATFGCGQKTGFSRDFSNVTESTILDDEKTTLDDKKLHVRT